jgi:predicted kinase
MAMTLFHTLTPTLENPLADWPAIETAFAWFRRLKDCSQDATFHAEGNVAIHTRMVVEALLADPDWRNRPDAERQSLFWAALLHDVAKPATTRTEPDGRITAPGHSRRGQIMARGILYEMGVPFYEREQICHLITHHQLPFYLLERECPERRAHLISHQTRCDLLATLASADAHGRICPDVARLLDNIALFRELCREEACFDNPKTFASDHSRFLYFRRDDRAADYEAFDDWEGQVTILSGLPGTGKDNWLAANAGALPIISLDELRGTLGVDPADSQAPVITAARKRARELLRAHQPFVWNATNISRQLRKQLIDLFADYKAKIRIVYVEASAKEATRRNGDRASPVPAAAIARMMSRWEPPDLTECHELEIVLT